MRGTSTGGKRRGFVSSALGGGKRLREEGETSSKDRNLLKFVEETFFRSWWCWLFRLIRDGAEQIGMTSKDQFFSQQWDTVEISVCKDSSGVSPVFVFSFPTFI